MLQHKSKAQRFVNPLEATRITTNYFENTVPGVCPKCNLSMITIYLNELPIPQEVYLCSNCRVVEPLPE